MISTLLTRGETGAANAGDYGAVFQSTHARGDTLTRVTDPQSENFNPLPSCEGRHRRTRLSFSSSTFQSTPLIRGETYKASVQTSAEPDFNPLPSCEGRREESAASITVTAFQSAPLMRGETCSGLMRMLPLAFQSTPLMRGETIEDEYAAFCLDISIHSPHARGDRR